MLWPAPAVFAHHVQPVSREVQTWAKGEPAGSPLGPGYVPSILGEEIIANFLTVPPDCCALKNQPHTQSWIILICPAGVTPLVQGKFLAWPTWRLYAVIHQCWLEESPTTSYSCRSSFPGLSGCKPWANADVSRARETRLLTMKTSHKHLCQQGEVL